ncbi:hypothetical protein QFZ74_005029 [Streptomyces sp. V3I7]|nr:hypothetical protein [Streptomyces sp. V3I7]
MTVRAVVRRGVGVGVRIGVWPAGVGGGLCLVGALVFMRGGRWGTVWALISLGTWGVAGSMAGGVVLGVLIGVVLAVAPCRVIARPVLRGLLAGAVTGVPLAALAVGLLTGDGYSLASYPRSVHVLTWSLILVVSLVAAALSADIAGTGRTSLPASPCRARRRGYGTGAC